MNKAQLIVSVSKQARCSKALAGRAVDAVFDNIKKNAKRGIYLRPFGTFKVVRRKAKRYRNPRTGKLAVAKPCKVVKFKAGMDLEQD